MFLLGVPSGGLTAVRLSGGGSRPLQPGVTRLPSGLRRRGMTEPLANHFRLKLDNLALASTSAAVVKSVKPN